MRTAAAGHEYTFSEGAIAMIDSADKPARTMLTSEGSLSRSPILSKTLKQVNQQHFLFPYNIGQKSA